MEKQIFDEESDLIFLLLRKSKRSSAINQGHTSHDSSDQTPSSNEPESPPTKVQLLVSSKHLTLASPVFKAMLKYKNFVPEKNGTGSAGEPMEIKLPDNPPSSFILLMKIVHGRSQNLPPTLRWRLLREIGILADKYQMAEAVQFHARSWFTISINQLGFFRYNGKLFSSRKSNYEALMLSWVFGFEPEFKILTRDVVRSEKREQFIVEFGEALPIPEMVIQALKHSRCKAITRFYELVEETVNKCLLLTLKPGNSQSHCKNLIVNGDSSFNDNCDAMVLGSLLGGAIKSKIYPIPTDPFNGVSFEDLVLLIRLLSIKSLCDSLETPPIDYQPNHGIRSGLQKELKAIDEGFCGLNLADFKTSRRVEGEAHCVGVCSILVVTQRIGNKAGLGCD